MCRHSERSGGGEHPGVQAARAGCFGSVESDEGRRESASDGENESAYAAGSKREDSGLTKRTDLATRHLEKGGLDCYVSASRTEPSSVKAAVLRGPAPSASLLTHGQTW